MKNLLAIYSCDEHRTHDSMRLISAINKDDENDVKLLGSLIRTTLVNDGDTTIHDFSDEELVERAIEQMIEYLHIEAISPITELKDTFDF